MADDLLAPVFDRVPPGPAEPPARCYLVCATPRSGSTLLTEALRYTGVLGVPAEYLNVDAVVRPLADRWGSPDGGAYVHDLYRHRTSSDGVLGVKLHWQQVQEMDTRLGLRRDDESAGAMLERLFPGATYVHVQRADRMRQAVSYWRARKSRQWSVHAGEEPPPVDEGSVDPGGIDACHEVLDEGEVGWAALFAERSIEPVRVCYEELSSAYAATVASVARQLGVDVDADGVAPPRLRRQADGRTDEVLREWLRERRRGDVDRASG